MGFVLTLIVLFGQSVELQPNHSALSVIAAEAAWEDVTDKIPGNVSQAFFLASKSESCLAIFIDDAQGGELRFSTGKGARWGNDVRIGKKNGRATYLSGLNRKAVKPNDPAFAYCVERVKTAPEFPAELRARFLGFGGIK